MAATNFKTENSTLRKLIANGLTYRIPRFQRDYSWNVEEWEDLWADLQSTLSPNSGLAHYMGYLVLQSSDDRNFDVIDGQQRLTTISTIILAILKNFERLVNSKTESDANQRRMDQIRQTFIGYLDPVTLVAKPKLTLNRNNNNYYQNYMVPLGVLPKRNIRASEHLLRKAFDWFDKEISNFLKSESGQEGMRLAKLVEELSDKMFFTVITVTDELNAYKVFETLNARGVRLSSTDLLKNFLFSVLDRKAGGLDDPHELGNLEERWERMVDRLGAESFPDFLRVHWNSRRNFARQSELFKTIRGQIVSREDVFRLLREMEEDLDSYITLSSPENSDWDNDVKEQVRILRTFNVRQPFPLLLAAKRKFNTLDFSGLIRSCVVISMRFNVICGFSTGEQERVYNEVAQRIARDEFSNLHAALTAMQRIYPADSIFVGAFSEKTIRTTQSRNNKVVRYILSSLEKYLTQIEIDNSAANTSIEHVLPQNPGDGWDQFSDEEVGAFAYRLGNMTLLAANSNKDAGNQTHELKRKEYERSTYSITKKIASDYPQWTVSQIENRQKWMAKQATAIWRIAQLHG
jgi:hypothetical protein